MPVVEAAGVLDVDVLVDARAPERYRGDVEPIDPVAGRIPGAVNVPTTANVAPDGRFRSPAELAAVYAEVGAVPGGGRGGVLRLGRHGRPRRAGDGGGRVRAALYPGSWSGWITDPDRPVERG